MQYVHCGILPNYSFVAKQAMLTGNLQCGKLGHISRDCNAPNGGPLSTAGKTCYTCGQAGTFSLRPIYME